jgi:hypothetical protein
MTSRIEVMMKLGTHYVMTADIERRYTHRQKNGYARRKYVLGRGAWTEMSYSVFVHADTAGHG